MRRTLIAMGCAVLWAGGCASHEQVTYLPDGTGLVPSTLGAFSVSLAVKDLQASRAFYEKLGFQATGGDPAQGWLILRNRTTTIGLFHGMFEKNMLTFNPGWDALANPAAGSDDVRDIQRDLKSKGLTLSLEADPSSTGPASIMLLDPDGNPILIDQHVPRPDR